MAWWNKGKDGGPESEDPGAGPSRSDSSWVPASVELFEDWLEDMDARLAGFCDFGLPRELTAEPFTREALAELGPVILSRYSSEAEVVAPGDHRGWIDGCVRYVGETLIRACGGRWFYDTSPTAANRGVPAVGLDVEDRLSISPFHLIRRVVRDQDPDYLTFIFDAQLAQALDWAVKDGHGAPRIERPAPPAGFLEDRSAFLAAWPDRLAADVDRFVSANADRGPWDFTAASLDRLERLVVERYPTVQTLRHDAAGHEAAAGYYGETLHRLYGGRWSYNPGERVEDDPFVGTPMLRRGDGPGDRDDDSVAIPVVDLEVAVEARDGSTLAVMAENYAED